MPAFGREACSKRGEIDEVADYVRSLVGPADRRRRPTSRPARKVFADNCAACHGEDGKGNRELGAPNLTDAIWLYGFDRRPSSTASPTAAPA